MKNWRKMIFFAMLSSMLCAGSTQEALVELKKSPFGFAFFDVGIRPWDLQLFDSINIEREWVYHRFGELEEIENSIADFMSEIGSNDPCVATRTALRIKEIILAMIQASGKDTAWVSLRSFIPISRYDVPRWHVDGPYYHPEGSEDLIFKFVVTLVGPSTYFYPLSQKSRKTSEKMIHNRLYMKQFCKPENILSPLRGEGALFRAGSYTGFAALHSEPPIHENRLFLSIVPCTEAQLGSVKERVSAIYPKSSIK